MPFQIVRNDITKMQVDAIVNTANPGPGYAAGIDAAVYKAAGEKELLAKRHEIGMIERGHSVITDGYKLPAKYIIHTVGTAWQGGSYGEEEYAREEDRPSKTLFVITTDGLENASKNYSFKDVKKMIERQKENYNWEFLFLGANIDAVEVAGNMGISRDRAANYNCDEEGTSLNYQVLEEAVTRVRKCKSSADMSMAFSGGAWKADIDRDYEKRGKKNGSRAQN